MRLPNTALQPRPMLVREGPVQDSAGWRRYGGLCHLCGCFPDPPPFIVLHSSFSVWRAPSPQPPFLKPLDKPPVL